VKSIRCGRGLGDSIYLHAVVRHMLKRGGLKMRVKSDYPDVFLPLGDRVEVVPFDRRVDIVAHYSVRKGIEGTTQFQDCCLAAGIHEPVEFRVDWTVTNQSLVDSMRSSGRPVLVVQLPRTPMGRTDGFGASLLPDCRAIQRLINEAKETHTVVQIGAGVPLYRFSGIDVDLANKTTVAELFDVVSAADRCLGYVSFLVPMAEVLDKPATFVWSARGLKDGQLFVRRITPKKILHKPTSKYVIDAQLMESV
jgi:thiol-disulfide isomerase/thioredoxin